MSSAETKNALWASLVGASQNWIERESYRLPFQGIDEGVLRESARCWRSSRWTLVLGGPDDKFHTRFLDVCKRIEGREGTVWKKVSMRSKGKKMLGRVHTVSSSSFLPNTLFVYTRRPRKKFHSKILERKSGKRGDPWPQLSIASHVYFTRGKYESELFSDTLLETIFGDPFLFPLVMHRITNILGMEEPSTFSRNMSILSCAVNWFIDSEASRHQFLSLIQPMDSSPKKRKRVFSASEDESIMGLLSIRERAYRNSPSSSSMDMNTPISTLYLIRTWMTSLLSQYLSPNVFLHLAFSSLMVQFYRPEIFTLEKERIAVGTYTLNQIMHHYFSSPMPEEGHPLREVLENDPSLMEAVAMSHLSSVICTESLSWPPYNDTDQLSSASIGTRWEFTCMTLVQRYEDAKYQSIEYYGPDVFTFVQKIPEPQLVLAIYGCSMAQTFFLLDVVQFILRHSFGGNRIVYTSREYLSALTGENDYEDHQRECNNQTHDDGDEDIGDHSSDCEERMVNPKLEDLDPFLFYFQILPKGNHASCISVGIGEEDPLSITSFFGSLGSCSTSEEEEYTIENGIEFPFPDATTNIQSKTSEDIMNILSLRMIHTMRLCTLWIRMASRHRYITQSHSTLSPICPIYPILGQVLDMCYRESRGIDEMNSPFLHIVRSEAALVFKMLTKNFSTLDIQPKDIDMGMLFLYAVPVLWKSSFSIETIRRFIRAIDVCPVLQEVFKEEGGSLKKHTPSTQIIDGIMECPYTMTMIEDLGIESIEIVQSGPNSFLGRRREETSIEEEEEEEEEREKEDEELSIIGQTPIRTRFYFDYDTWTLFSRHLTREVWKSNEELFQSIIEELSNHLISFDEFAKKNLLHKLPREEKRKSKEDLPLLEAISKERGFEEMLAVECTNPFIGLTMKLEGEEGIGYSDILTMPVGGPYSFHIPVDVIQTAFLERKKKGTQYEFVYFDETLSIPKVLPGKGWQMFEEHCGSSFIPDMLYLFGRNDTAGRYFME